MKIARIIITLLLLSLLVVTPVLAQGGTGTGTGGTDLSGQMCKIYDTSISFLKAAGAVVTVVILLYWGFRELLSSILRDFKLSTSQMLIAITVGLVLLGYGQQIAEQVLGIFGLTISC